MFANLENWGQDEGASAGIIEGTDKFGQNFVLANVGGNFVKLLSQAGEKSTLFLVVFDLKWMMKKLNSDKEPIRSLKAMPEFPLKIASSL